ncbi:ATP-binding cassette domain-containing protein [Streptacidiphilus jiangxiensis]|uniref:ABC-2 type transport system ATP-binding protein n=1 Tax=Streptacidiphilus jiangxiensis TaxID=235985 RepID=A0A1H7KP97_STRJI|nr:ATP-binding cassette domain-containing protein [Streptacidiphilus jiangxiensis]SEK87875.1 ABC-2 type transport system ATP-binding protein [Streptacidiphilus jiangxiensis]
MAQTVQTQADEAARGQQVRQGHHPFQAIGLTKAGRRGRPPVLLDVSFDARAGQVTVLLGPEGSGRTTALRLALGLDKGQGAALFHGRPYRRLSRPEREVGVVLGEADRPAGHPGRRARAHLRMMAAAAGVPARRADQLLEQTRLGPAAEHRLRTFSPGMNRRLQLAQALLGDPGTLVLDEPTEGLSPKNVEWFHAFLRAFTAGGGAVLVTLRSPQQAAQLADRVVTIDLGRVLADQPVEEFRRTRLRDEVSVRGPQVGRLADLLSASGATVRHDGGNAIAVEGMARTEIGELAFRHGILLHELADHVVEHAPAPGPRPAEPAGATLARASVALGPGETVTTHVIVPAEPGPAVLPARRAPEVGEPLFDDEDD